MELPDALFNRTELLNQAVFELLEHPIQDQVPRVATSAAFCYIAFEHSAAAVELLRNGYCTSAFVVHRVQFEALVRSIWVLHGATDAQFEKLLPDLTRVSEKSANGLPMVADMIRKLEQHPVACVPAATLQEFKHYSWGALNSFVHAGIHPLARTNQGYPPTILYQLLRTINGLMHFTACQMAILTGVPGLQTTLNSLSSPFSDVLPTLKVEKPSSSNLSSQP